MQQTVFSGEISFFSSGPLPEIKSDEHKPQYVKERERERECLEVNIYCKLDLEVPAVNVGKRLEAKVTAMRSKCHLTNDIIEEIYFIKSFQ